jgi:carboxyl-terminal processing protease
MIKRLAASVTCSFLFTTGAVTAQSVPDFTRPMGEGPPEVEVIVSAVDAISSMHMESFSDSLLWEAAIDGLIEALDDPYAELFTPQDAEEWEEDTTGNYSGIGLQITLLNDEITVTAVFRGFPASEHGLAVGDVIVGVNAYDATDWDTGMAADTIRGPVGTSVEVHIKRSGYEQPITYDITRAAVHVPAVTWGILEEDIGYVIMDRVARNAAREMNEALAELEGRKGLIIDLRRNPGGFLNESLMLADLFLPTGSTLASTVQRAPGGSAETPETESYGDRWPQLVPDLPIVILVDEFTASGAEILAGALQDYDRAIVLGQRTFGKGVVQTVMDLPYGRKLRFTTGSWLTPLGRSLQRPRDRQMVPLEEDLDNAPRIQSAEGRELINAGGVFPDLEIQDDTLKTTEQDFIRASNEAQFPLGLRIAEAGLATATVRRAANEGPGITDSEFEEFLASLVDEGLETSLLESDDVNAYLRWRMNMSTAQRMDDIAVEARFRTERDPVLTEAIQLLLKAQSQSDLFRAVDAAPGATQAPGSGGK